MYVCKAFLACTLIPKLINVRDKRYKLYSSSDIVQVISQRGCDVLNVKNA